MNLTSVTHTPTFVVDVPLLKKNLANAARIKKEAGCKMLLATKAFATPELFPHFRKVLDGSTASGLYEAKLGHDEFGKEVHVYSPAYGADEIRQIIKLADHIYFNSLSQLRQYGPLIKKAGKHVGIRLNPGYSMATLGGALYDPCAPGSRFGIQPRELKDVPWHMVDILHAHTLCEATDKGSVGLIRHVGTHFGEYVRKVNTVNFGGGHFFNRKGYNIPALIKAVRDFRREFKKQVILEPGGTLVYNAGFLVSEVRDVLTAGKKARAVLDTSATCHMPDALEVPFTPHILGAVDAKAATRAEKSQYPHEYILGGVTCMTGDVIGAYRFKKPLKTGDRLVFTDAAQYSIVKTTSFNGTPLPAIAVRDEKGAIKIVRKPSYGDFRNRLG